MSIAPKHLSISVTDADNQPVKEVTIKIYKEGESDYTETITHENGQASLLENLSPGNYTISGTKGKSTTNKVQLTTEHFKSADKVIGIKLTLQP
ncbi:carboxypeptidase-like regulatory domain-containing protein [Niabella hibiscisoli]|uniref:carboxypeptidase-like regulatory domain-containing protein n=1 Tax=Niabella hibiscisoli TaxID=1825928 RepID=UPI001F0DA2B2|nr:carboxypeptidase-like regulatory domain-containing protein [Niabella hibiscisoli]MCH5721017.1 carboxypeptidase-like regulatory domain-containing protein [Niabella hibiscisoli]